MQITDNLGLQKPSPSETFDIEYQNSNMDIIDEAIKTLLERYNTEVDWVVEQKTEGIWTWRKWNSGIAECWGYESKTFAVTSSYGGHYYTSTSVSLPAGLFTSVKSANVNRAGGTTSTSLSITSMNKCSKDSLNYYIFNATSLSEFTCNVSYEVKGRWK